MTTQPLRDMDQRRLKAELVTAEQQLRNHGQRGNWSWCRQGCEEEWPCQKFDAAKQRFDAIAAELIDRAKAVEDVREVWQR